MFDGKQWNRSMQCLPVDTRAVEYRTEGKVEAIPFER